MWFDEFEIQFCLSDNNAMDITKLTGTGKEKKPTLRRDGTMLRLSPKTKRASMEFELLPTQQDTKNISDWH